MDDELKELLDAASRICVFFAFAEAEAECIDEPMKDTDIIASFMGSGASDNLTVGDVRRLRAAAEAVAR